MKPNGLFAISLIYIGAMMGLMVGCGSDSPKPVIVVQPISLDAAGTKVFESSKDNFGIKTSLTITDENEFFRFTLKREGTATGGTKIGCSPSKTIDDTTVYKNDFLFLESSAESEDSIEKIFGFYHANLFTDASSSIKNLRVSDMTVDSLSHSLQFIINLIPADACPEASISFDIPTDTDASANEKAVDFITSVCRAGK